VRKKTSKKIKYLRVGIVRQTPERAYLTLKVPADAAPEPFEEWVEENVDLYDLDYVAEYDTETKIQVLGEATDEKADYRLELKNGVLVEA